MPQDVVQIGPLIISKTVIDVLAPLIGTIIGGLIAYWATRADADRKWKQQKIDRRNEQKQEALAKALDWIEPIERAVITANALAGAFKYGNIDDKELRAKWPDLMIELAKVDMPMRFRVLLPPDIARRGFDMHDKIEDLRAAVLSSKGNWFEIAANLHTEVVALQIDMSNAYDKTFE